MAKIVWILGAGFSRSLGGPLLADLFTTGSLARCRKHFPLIDYPLLGNSHAKDALELYKWGCDRELGVQWSDPEEFLEKLDIAASLAPNSATRRIYAALLSKDNPDFPELSIAARRIMAAECSSFLRENDPSWERWRPYTKWARQLTGDDVIVTFNYDLVPAPLNEISHGKPHRFLMLKTRMFMGLVFSVTR